MAITPVQVPQFVKFQDLSDEEEDRIASGSGSDDEDLAIQPTKLGQMIPKMPNLMIQPPPIINPLEQSGVQPFVVKMPNPNLVGTAIETVGEVVGKGLDLGKAIVNRDTTGIIAKNNLEITKEQAAAIRHSADRMYHMTQQKTEQVKAVESAKIHDSTEKTKRVQAQCAMQVEMNKANAEKEIRLAEIQAHSQENLYGLQIQASAVKKGHIHARIQTQNTPQLTDAPELSNA